MTQDTNASLVTGGNSGSGSEGTVATLPTFAEQLDGSLRQDPGISQFLGTYKDKKLGDFVRDAYERGKSLESLRGEVEGKVKIPGENATPEERAQFRKAMNIPEKAEGYELQRPEKLPEGMHYDETLEANFRTTAHKLGLTPAQVKGLFDFYNQYQISNYEGINKLLNENKEKSINTLKDIWKGDQYEANKKKAVLAFHDSLKKFNPPKELGGSEAIIQEFNESGFGDSPAIIWYFSQIANLVGIDTFGQRSSQPGNTNQKPGLDFSKSMPI